MAGTEVIAPSNASGNIAEAANMPAIYLEALLDVSRISLLNTSLALLAVSFL